MPFAGPYSRSGGHCFHQQRNTRPGLRNGLKTRLCERFISSVFENTADLRLFLNGARYGLLLSVLEGNRGLKQARIGVGSLRDSRAKTRPVAVSYDRYRAKNKIDVNNGPPHSDHFSKKKDQTVTFLYPPLI
jgi:hypothetical protein